MSSASSSLLSMSSKLTLKNGGQSSYPGKSEGDDNKEQLDDHDYDHNIVANKNKSITSITDYLPSFSQLWDFLIKVWKIVSLLLNFALIVMSFYWSYMLFKAVNCAEEDEQCYEDTAWVVYWTTWLFEAVMPNNENSQDF